MRTTQVIRRWIEGFICFGAVACGGRPQLVSGGPQMETDGGPRASCGSSDGVEIVDVSAGNSYTCVVTRTGGVRCWGANYNGQLGDGTTTNRLTFPTNDVLTGVKTISVASGNMNNVYGQTCALMTTGGVRCWGNNHDGQLGDGTIENRLSPRRTM